jgi:hypothetical protein
VCGNQCTFQGKYCSGDPEKNSTVGIDGKDILLQDLRELCLWRWINQTFTPQGHNQHLWFDFTADFNTNCYDVNKPELWREDTCANAIFDKYKIDKVWIADCIAQSGGADGTGRNTLLDAAVTEWQLYNIIYLPLALVNLVPYRGTLTCPDPVKSDGKCGLLDAICNGYADTPAVCETSKDCPFGVNMDECGVCGGDQLRDVCGVCMKRSDPLFHQLFNQTCIGCDGVINSGKVVDPCGVCGGSGTSPCLSAGAIVGIVFGALGVLALVGLGVYFYMKRQNNKMREDIDSLLKQYLPLEGGVNTGAGNTRLVDATADSDM